LAKKLLNFSKVTQITRLYIITVRIHEFSMDLSSHIDVGIAAINPHEFITWRVSTWIALSAQNYGSRGEYYCSFQDNLLPLAHSFE